MTAPHPAAESASPLPPRPSAAPWWWLLAIVGVILVGVWWSQFELPDAANRLAAVPERGRFFQIQTLPLSDLETQLLRGATGYKRLLRVGETTLLVLWVDGTRNRHAVHDPTYCLRGAGWEIVAEADFAMANGSGRRLELRRGSETGTAAFWYSDGEQTFAAAPQYWWQSTLRRWTLGASGPEPVLVVATPLTPAPDWAALARQWPHLLAP